MNCKRFKDEKGFTLIEIIIVIAILGILAMMAAPSVSQVLSDSSTLSHKNEQEVASSAFKQYEAEYGEKATSVAEVENSQMLKRDNNKYNYEIDSTSGDVVVSKKPIRVE